MTRQRKIGLVLTLAGLAVLAAGMTGFIARAKAHNRAQDYPHFHVEAIGARVIDYLDGYPRLELTDVSDDAGNAYLRAEYGDRIELIPVQAPPIAGTPTLELYDEWAKLLWLNEVERDDAGRPAAADGTGRLVLVVRRPPAGYDAETWGRVRRSESVFDFYTFLPDGSIDIDVRRWPRSYSSERYLRERAEKAEEHGVSAEDVAPDAEALREAEAAALMEIPPLEERSWRWTAALHVIPKLSVPTQKFEDTALNFRVAGWTFPAMFAGVMTAAIGLVVFAAPRGRTGDTAAPRRKPE